MHARAWIVVVLASVACGGPATDDAPPVTDGETVEPPEADTATDTATPSEADGEPEPPTGVTAACWSWSVGWYDGDLSGEYVRYYDPATLNQTHYEADYEADGVLDYAWDAAFEPNGEDYSWIHYDTDGDGTVDEVVEYGYDAAGLRTRYSYDANGDGLWEEVWTYEYLGEVRAMAYADEGDDGTIDVWYTYTADAADRVVRIDGDRGDDGVVDEVYEYLYADLVTSDYTYTVDADADGVPEEVRTYGFDAEGRVVAYTYDLDDGTSTASAYTYGSGASDDVVADEGSAAYPGQDPYTWTSDYTYEAPGKLSEGVTVYDFGSSGTGEYVQERVWTCP